MPSAYHLTEPFPKVPTTYTHTGRGGAGNIAKPRSNVPITTSRNVSVVTTPEASGPYPPPQGVSVTEKPSPRHRNFTAGRGGIGNLHPASERAIFSFDEELERLRKAEDTIAPIYHIGRGGEGNLVDNRKISSAESTRSGSISSRESENGFRSSIDRVRARFSRQQGGGAS
jgi:hypothetical protein